MVLDCAMTLELGAQMFNTFLYLEDDVLLSPSAPAKITSILTKHYAENMGPVLTRLSVGGMLGVIYDSRLVRFITLSVTMIEKK